MNPSDETWKAPASEARPWSILANHSQGARAVGGRLSVVDGRLKFQPNAFDALTGGKAVDLPFAGLDFGRSEAAWSLGNLFSGGLRARLAVRLPDGSEELFVVNGLDRVISDLQAMR